MHTHAYKDTYFHTHTHTHTHSHTHTHTHTHMHANTHTRSLTHFLFSVIGLTNPNGHAANEDDRSTTLKKNYFLNPGKHDREKESL